MAQSSKTVNIGINKLTLISEKDNHTIKMTNSKGEVYSRRFTIYEDLPYSAQKFFPTLQDFIKAFQNVINEKNPSNFVAIIDNLNLTLKLKISIGNFQMYHHIKIDLLSENNQLESLTNKLNQMEKRLAEFMGDLEKQKQKQKDQKKNLLQMEILPKKKQKQDKKAEKEKQKEKQKQKQKANNKDLKKPELKEIQSIKPFKVEDKKVTITDPAHKIEASLVSKEGINLISVSVYIVNTKLTYVGELNDTEIEEFLYEPTKIRNALQLFQQIKRNSLKQNKNSLKINEKENKLEILINIPASKDKLMTSKVGEEDTIFAEIDIKPIKQEHREQKETIKSTTPKSNKKSLDTSKDFDAKSSRSFSQPMTKQSLINNVKQSLLGQTKTKKKDAIYSSFDQISKSGRKKKSDPKANQDNISEISFKTKNTVQKLKQAKEAKQVKSRKKNKSSDDPDGDFSLSFSHPIRSKSKK